jgi:hypothetical protein
MRDGALRPGERFALTLGAVADPDTRMVVVLRRDASGPWTVVFPEDPEDVIPLSALPADATGARRLDVVAAPTPGTQRWAVALPLIEPGPDWSVGSAERWAGLRGALGRGEVPAASVVVEVVALAPI